MEVETKKMADSAVAAGDNWGDGASPGRSGSRRFYNDVRTEMRKVTSPSRKEVQATTTVVIITVFLFGVYFWIVDMAISRRLDRVLLIFAQRLTEAGKRRKSTMPDEEKNETSNGEKPLQRRGAAAASRPRIRI